MLTLVPSVLWCCWLGGRKGIRSVKKTERWGAGVAICLERGADLHMAQLMPLPLTVSCFSKIQIGFTFLVPAHPGSPWKGQLNGCVCDVNTCWWSFSKSAGYHLIFFIIPKENLWGINCRGFCKQMPLLSSNNSDKALKGTQMLLQISLVVMY